MPKRVPIDVTKAVPRLSPQFERNWILFEAEPIVWLSRTKLILKRDLLNLKLVERHFLSFVIATTHAFRFWSKKSVHLYGLYFILNENNPNIFNATLQYLYFVHDDVRIDWHSKCFEMRREESCFPPQWKGLFMRGNESREFSPIPAIRFGIRLQFEWPQGTPFLPNNSSRRGDFVSREWNMVLEAIFMPLLFLLSGVFDTLCTQHLVYLGASSRSAHHTHYV